MKRSRSLAFFMLISNLLPGQTILFNDSDDELLKLSNENFYEIAFRKSNGSVFYIIDKSTNQEISKGSHSENLWYAILPPAQELSFIGGSDYSPEGVNKFQYAWDDDLNKLTMDYIPDPSSNNRLEVEITVTASDQNSLDFKASLVNNYGFNLEYFNLPADLILLQDEVEEALLPIIPGLILKKSFFEQDGSYQTQYPGWIGCFSPFVSIKLAQEQLALYMIHDQNEPVQVVDFGFQDDDGFVANATYIPFQFRTFIEDGEEWDSNVIRIRIGQDHIASIDDFRKDNEFDLLESVLEKLGDDFIAVSKSTWYNTDFELKFSDINPVIDALPSPGIVYASSWYPGGFDHNYPDFLPPDPNYGTTEEMAALIQRAHDRGLFSMPYTNPTWWDLQSPTVQNLPGLTAADIAVQDHEGAPLIENYGIDGIVVSPEHPFVIERIDKLLNDMRELVGSDFIYLDQIGARQQYFLDFNSTASSKINYLEGWREFTQDHRDIDLGAEKGFDLLIDSHNFFFGTLLLHKLVGDLDRDLGANNWAYYPLTTILAGDKALYYQTTGGGDEHVINIENLSLNMAMGTMMGWSVPPDLNDWDEWVDVASLYQQKIASRYAGVRMSDYRNLGDQVTESSFENLIIFKNWSSSSSYTTTDGHEIPPVGALALSMDGNLIGGVFTSYFGNELSSGHHYIIQENKVSKDSILIWYPKGEGTSLTLAIPTEWEDPESVGVEGISGESTIRVESEISEGNITFTINRLISGEKVDYYVLRPNVVTGIDDTEESNRLQLGHNYPNPFFNRTTITYYLPTALQTKLRVLDLFGNEMTLREDSQGPRHYAHILNGSALPNGIYLVQLQAGDEVLTQKMVLLK